MVAFIFTLVILGGIFLLFGLKIVNQFERGVLFTLGKYSGIMSPGLRLVVPLFQSWMRVDIRTKAVDVPDQDCITADNVSVNVNAVIYYKVQNAEKAIIEVENYYYAVSQLAQTTMRNIVGEVALDELLSNRDKVANRIQEIIDKESDPWGIKVNSVDLKDIVLPADLKRVIGQAAEAEREKRAVIIKASGEAEAAANMAKAARILAESPGGLHLRTLQTVNEVSADQSNTIVFAVPIEVLRAFDSYGKKRKEQ